MNKIEQLLNKIKPEQGSGLNEFDKKEFQEKKEILKAEKLELIDEFFETNKALFLKQNYSEILDTLYQDPSKISSHKIKALKFLAEIKLGFKPQLNSFLKRDDFYEYKKDTQFAYELIKLSKELSICDVDFFDYCELLVPLTYYWIKNQLLDFNLNIREDCLEDFLSKIEKCEADISQKYNNDKDVKEDFAFKKLYIKTLIYKINNNESQLNKSLQEYFDKTLNQDEQITSLDLIANKNFFHGDQVLSNLETLYAEVEEICAFITSRSLISANTCQSYNCADCCKQTSPSMSYTEFEFIKNWARKNNFDLSPAIKKAQKIISENAQQINFKIEEQTNSIDLNPNNQKYECPFLEEGLCSIHEARPLNCRIFGQGSADAMFLKSCNFFMNQYQYFASPENERLVYDARGFQAMLTESDKYLTQAKFAKTGLIPSFLIESDII